MPTYFANEPGNCCELFAASYELATTPAMLEIERSVLGCDYGGTSWTTREQAAGIAAALDLGRESHVLDIGSGSGWPALYVAAVSGCDVTLLDLPRNALAMARRRAEADGLANRVIVVSASGAALPFASSSFSAITHSDVLCCLPDKTGMLEECRRVAGGGGRMHFSVIALAGGLGATERQRAIDAGPPFLEAPADYPELLERCGWRVLERSDCTAEHRESLSRLIDGMQSSKALTAQMDAGTIEEACAHRRQQIEVIDAGLLIRETFLAEVR